jgi:DNA-binding beta-propeller fold protein YncE
VLVSAGHDGTVRLWDAATARELPQSGGQATWVALSPDGTKVAASTGEALVRFWDPATGRELLPPLALDGPVRTMAFSADGRSLLLSDSADELQVWDVAAGKRAKTIGARGKTPTTRLAVGPGGRVAATANEGAIHLWDLEAGRRAPEPAPLLAGVRATPPVRSVAFSPDEGRLAVGCGDGRVHLLDFATGRATLPSAAAGRETGAVAVAWSRDGRAFAALGGTDRLMRVWEAAGRRERVAPLAVPAGSAVAFSPDGRILASGGYTGALFTPDGRFLLSASTDTLLPTLKNADVRLQGEQTALVWDVAALAKDLPVVPKPAAGEVEGLWEALKGADAVKAHEAVWRLAAAPDLALPLLTERLPKVTPDAPDARVGRLLADLDGDEFDVREKATQELIRLGPAALPAVRRVLAATKSREVRRRAEEVLGRAGDDGGVNQDEVLLARGVEVLQHINAPEARQLLESWAKGDSVLAREARLALQTAAKTP